MDEILQHIIQLVILALPLLALPFVLKSSSQVLGQIGNKAEQFSRAAGNSRAAGGVKGFAKNRALGAEARMATAGLDGNPDTRRNRALRLAGGYRKRKEMKGKNREAIRARHQEEGYYAGMADDPSLGGPDPDAARRRRRAMGMGGAVAVEEAARLARQAGGYSDAKERERVAEEMKHEALRLDAQFRPGPTQGADLRAELDRAINAQEPVQIRAVMKKISETGSKEDIAETGRLVQRASAGGALNQAQQTAIAEGIQDNFSDFKARDPMLAGLDLSTGGQVGGTTSVAPEQLSTMAGTRLEELAGSGAISAEMVGEAAASGNLKLDPGRQASLERGLSHHAGTTQTVNDLRVAHEAAPIIAAATATPGPTPTPTPSDRRLKKDIIRISEFNDIPLYRFKYLWGEKEYVGTMAQDIISAYPSSVSLDSKGFYRVDYSQLGFNMTTYENWAKSNKR